MSELLAENGFPKDWGLEIAYRGFSRNNQLRRYVVRLSVNGRQHYVATAESQEQAAMFYDLALWKFAPKLDKKLKPNDADNFLFITEEKVSRLIPRLNALYDQAPFRRSGDELIAEDTLRDAALREESPRRDSRPTRNLATYDRAIASLRKLRGVLLHELGLIDRRFLKLPFIHKLPDAVAKRRSVEEAARQISELCIAAEQSMERQREYYQKLVFENNAQFRD